MDARTNMLFVQDTAGRLEEVRNLIKKIDVPVRQVMIEARIVEASDTFSRNLGVRLGYNASAPNHLAGSGSASTQVLAGASLNNTAFNTGQIATPTPTINDFSNVNLPASTFTNIPGVAPGVFSFLLFNENQTRFLNLEISALQQDGKGKIISSPRVITADQQEATIESGTEIPYQQATSSGATSVSFQQATLSLKVKPQITPNDNVIMNLDIHNDSVGQSTPAGPAINTKKIKTQVLVDNGGTVVIGGIYVQTIQNTTNKVPVLGDLPLVGWMFKNNSKQNDKDELLIFITPRIIKESLTAR